MTYYYEKKGTLEYKNCQKLKYNCWNFKNAVKCLNNSKNTDKFQMSEQEDRVEQILQNLVQKDGKYKRYVIDIVGEGPIFL